MNLDVKIDGLEELAKDLNVLPKVLEREMRRAMQMSINLIEDQVVRRTPINTGALRQGIATEIRGRGIDMRGRVFAGGAGETYGLPVEHGRRPGKMPPVDAIEYWVKRELGVGGDESRQVAFLVARAIGRRGTKGAHMFEEGLKAAEEKVLNLWRGVPDRALKQL